MEHYELLLVIGLMLIAFFYSSVGHGGASGYLAIMALAGLPSDSIRSNALLLNLFVSGIAFISFYRAGYFRWRLSWPFLITSIPAAFIGAQFSLNPSAYKITLGILLMIAVARLFITHDNKELETRNPRILPGSAIGLALGLISGIIGIGGGILLSPILILARFARVKEASATAALFIFLNSFSGLAGLMQTKVVFPSGITWWITAVVIAAFLGSHLSSRSFSETRLRRILSVVLVAASIKLFFF